MKYKIGDILEWNDRPGEVFKIIGITYRGQYKYKYIKSETHKSDMEQVFTSSTFEHVSLVSKLERVLE